MDRRTIGALDRRYRCGSFASEESRHESGILSLRYLDEVAWIYIVHNTRSIDEQSFRELALIVWLHNCSRNNVSSVKLFEKQ